MATRRDFLVTSGLAVGATALPPWALELEAAEAAAIDKRKLADAALATTKRLGAGYADIRINRYRFESISTRERQVRNVARNQSLASACVCW